jgi:hypothetical protein
MAGAPLLALIPGPAGVAAGLEERDHAEGGVRKTAEAVAVTLAGRSVAGPVARQVPGVPGRGMALASPGRPAS